MLLTIHSFLGLLVCASCARLRGDKSVLDDILSEDKYDPRIRPAPSAPATNVSAHIFVRDLDNLDEQKTFSVQLTLRLNWKDERLTFDAKSANYITLTDSSLLWAPDIFFPNDVSGYQHELLQPNTLIRIYPDGGVFFSKRITLEFHCPMELKMFPFDSQACPLKLASYAYTAEEVALSWKEHDAVAYKKRLVLQGFSLEKISTKKATVKTPTGAYDTLEMTFHLDRNRSPYVRNVFVPLAMMVLLSYLQFWLQPSHLLTRVLIGISVLLTTSALLCIRIENHHWPDTSYNKLADVISGVSLAFLFASILLTVLVNNLVQEEGEIGSIPNKAVENVKALVRKLCPGTNCIDASCRILWPLLYAFLWVCVWICVSSHGGHDAELD